MKYLRALLPLFIINFAAAQVAVHVSDIKPVNTATVLGRATAGSGSAEQLATTGTGNVVLATAPTLTLPNATGLPVSTGISGLGTGVAAALAVNVGTAGAPVVNGGALGTPSSGVATNLTGTAAGLTAGTANAAPASGLTGTTLASNVILAPGLNLPINAISYGATGNGITDDSAALNAALAAVSSSGKALYIPAGTYRCKLTAFTANMVIYGDGPGHTILKQLDKDTDVIEITAASIHTVTIRDLSVAGLGLSGTGKGINAHDNNFFFNTVFNNVRADSLGSDGFYFKDIFSCAFRDCGASDNLGNQFNIVASTMIELTSCYVQNVPTSGKAGYVIRAGNFVMTNCNGIDSGETWGVFGAEPGDEGGQIYTNGSLIGCNVEAFTVNGIYVRAGTLNIIGGSLYAGGANVYGIRHTGDDATGSVLGTIHNMKISAASGSFIHGTPFQVDNGIKWPFTMVGFYNTTFYDSGGTGICNMSRQTRTYVGYREGVPTVVDFFKNLAISNTLEIANTGATYQFENLGTSHFAGAITADAGLTGNASTATKLATARAINGVNFDGSAAITVPAAAGTLTGATLASGITASSLTSFGAAPALGAATATSIASSGAVNAGARSVVTTAQGTIDLGGLSGSAGLVVTQTSGTVPYIRIADTSGTGSLGVYQWEVGRGSQNKIGLYRVSGTSAELASWNSAGDLTTLGALTFGGGTKILKVISATATLDFPSTLTGAVSDLTITLTGAAVGDTVSLGVPNGSVTATGVFTAWVSATNTVTVRFSHNAAGAEDPASGTFRATVTQF